MNLWHIFPSKTVIIFFLVFVFAFNICPIFADSAPREVEIVVKHKVDNRSVEYIGYCNKTKTLVFSCFTDLLIIDISENTTKISKNISVALLNSSKWCLNNDGLVVNFDYKDKIRLVSLFEPDVKTMTTLQKCKAEAQAYCKISSWKDYLIIKTVSLPKNTFYTSVYNIHTGKIIHLIESKKAPFCSLSDIEFIYNKGKSDEWEYFNILNGQKKVFRDSDLSEKRLADSKLISLTNGRILFLTKDNRFCLYDINRNREQILYKSNINFYPDEWMYSINDSYYFISMVTKADSELSAYFIDKFKVSRSGEINHQSFPITDKDEILKLMSISPDEKKALILFVSKTEQKYRYGIFEFPTGKITFLEGISNISEPFYSKLPVDWDLDTKKIIITDSSNEIPGIKVFDIDSGENILLINLKKISK